VEMKLLCSKRTHWMNVSGQLLAQPAVSIGWVGPKHGLEKRLVSIENRTQFVQHAARFRQVVFT